MGFLVGENFILQLHFIKHFCQWLCIRDFYADAFPAGSLQLGGAHLPYDASAIDESVMGGELGQLIQQMAGDQYGDLSFPIEL